MEKDVLKTGTTTVAVLCKEGVVLAADKRSSAGYMIANKREEKIIKISNRLAIAQAGLVSDAQLLSKLAKAEIKIKEIRSGKDVSVKEAANLIAGMLYVNIRKLSPLPGIVAFLLGGCDSQGPSIYTLGVDGSVTEMKDFASDGSGSVFALGVLETLYKKDMVLEEGIKLVAKAINASMQKDMATGNGIDIYTITKEGVKKVLTKSVETKLEL